jgi:dienelactone hydrolase
VQHLGRLVETQTPDGLRLHGFWQQARDATISMATPSVSRPLGWIIVHGVAGNFYNSSMLASIAESLLERGHDTCRINTRGRDPVAYVATPGGNTRLGAAYEMISDCLPDIEAWIDFLRRKGYERIGLIGHSLGAVKAAHFARSQGSIGIHCLICISPPRLAPAILAKDSHYGLSYAEDLRTAEEKVAMGRPEALLTIRYPQPMLISAATFLDKYGRSDQYDYVQMADQISIPCLWCFGDQEVRGDRASFKNCDQALEAKVEGQANHSLAIISNADHGYTQARAELNTVICRWISEKI